MEFFSHHWLLWASFFVPAYLWVAIGIRRERNSPKGTPPLWGTGAALLVLGISGLLLAFGFIHVAVDAILTLILH